MRLKQRLKKIPGFVKLVRMCRIALHPAYRSEWRLRRQNPDYLFQPFNETSHDRYPHIFSFVCERLADNDAPRILSYGCSTGEEVFCLREYFPRAEIVGIDINPYNITVCRNKWNETRPARVRFELAESPAAEPDSFYDAVFCMAVLRQGELDASKAKSCDHLIRFDSFDKMVNEFHRVLKPGGYLVIRHSNFRVADTSCPGEFDVVLAVIPNKSVERTPLYGSDNRLLENAVCNDTVFRKRNV